MSETNRFGGANVNGFYAPMSEVEQEVIARIVESQTLRVWVPKWIPTPIIPSKVLFGDKRVQLQFRVLFPPPMPMTRLPSIDMELRTADGYLLFAKPYPLMSAEGQPLLVGENLYFDLAWDIAIDHMDPKLVKAFKPSALGLTSRRLDRETGERTLTGNMRLGENDAAEYHKLDAVEEVTRSLDPQTIHRLTQKAAR
jgi:hypothetical protein